MPNLPDLEAWAIFARVVEHRSFTAAAAAMGMSKGTVSKAITRLEARLSAGLFHRTSRTLTLTEAGQRLVPHAARMLAEASAAEEAACEEHDQIGGPIRLAAPMTFGIQHVAPAVAEFMALHPAVTVRLDLSDARVDLIAEGHDAALRIGNLPDSSLIARRLKGVTVKIVAAPAYLAARGTPTHPVQLQEHDGLCYANAERPGEWRLRGKDGTEAIGRPRPRMTTGSGEAMLPALRDGLGIAVLPDFIVDSDLAAGRLVELLPGWAPPAVSLHLVTPPGRLRSARIGALLTFLTERFSR